MLSFCQPSIVDIVTLLLYVFVKVLYKLQSQNSEAVKKHCVFICPTEYSPHTLHWVL